MEPWCQRRWCSLLPTASLGEPCPPHLPPPAPCPPVLSVLSLHRRQSPEEWSVRLAAEPEEHSLKQLILHGAYTHPEGGYDVALLLLAQPVTLGPSLRPLCLPYADHRLPDGERGWVLGLAHQGAGI